MQNSIYCKQPTKLLHIKATIITPATLQTIWRNLYNNMLFVIEPFEISKKEVKRLCKNFTISCQICCQNHRIPKLWKD
ncbi:hypothetical protein T12_12991 [Trichinella patagoniensis]|uniref:Uncharacterized protein n=1 Tax=Trichinella patagoniensis TaxID=990121 RepID=A0A0V1AEQ7_9BILA|nr:hypothetical protein T12_12991 [Trichinella patagoniensis]